MDSKLTPGPYAAFTERVTERINGFEVCTTQKTDPQNHLVLLGIAVDQPTANLFAASWEMVDALEWVLSPADDCAKCRHAGGRCVGHTALAHARGEL